MSRVKADDTAALALRMESGSRIEQLVVLIGRIGVVDLDRGGSQLRRGVRRQQFRMPRHDRFGERRRGRAVHAVPRHFVNVGGNLANRPVVLGLIWRFECGCGRAKDLRPGNTRQREEKYSERDCGLHW
jgi:hypothetical protein